MIRVRYPMPVQVMVAGRGGISSLPDGRSLATARSSGARLIDPHRPRGIARGVGRSIPPLGSLGQDRFVCADFYAGLGSTGSFAARRASGEASNDRHSGDQDSMLGSGRLPGI